MSNKVSYTNLKLKTSTTVSTFIYNGHTIEVLDYLDINNKYDLVMITLQKSFEDGVYNPVKLDMYFHLHIVYLYTNLVFTDKQKENEPKLYDALKSNGFIDAVLEVMDEAEYNELFAWIEEIRNDSLKYKTSAAALLKGVIEDLPKNAQIAADVVNNFDPEKYKAVTDFANHANGDRPFNTKP